MRTYETILTETIGDHLLKVALNRSGWAMPRTPSGAVGRKQTSATNRAGSLPVDGVRHSDRLVLHHIRKQASISRGESGRDTEGRGEAQCGTSRGAPIENRAKHHGSVLGWCARRGRS